MVHLRVNGGPGTELSAAWHRREATVIGGMTLEMPAGVSAAETAAQVRRVIGGRVRTRHQEYLADMVRMVDAALSAAEALGDRRVLASARMLLAETYEAAVIGGLSQTEIGRLRGVSGQSVGQFIQRYRQRKGSAASEADV